MIEKEYKFMLMEEQYINMKNKLHWEEEVMQDNYYYLDDNDYIRMNNITVRIRKKHDSYLLQTKVAKYKNKSLFIKEENEKYIDRVYEFLTSDMLENMMECGFEKAYCIGKLVTVRNVLHMEHCELCLDLNQYLGKTDYELEIEYSDQISQKVLDILNEFSINMNTEAIGKNSRFLLEYDAQHM